MNFEHKLIGIVLNVKKENLNLIKKYLCEYSKKFQKDDLFYITSSRKIIENKEFSSYLLNSKPTQKINDELRIIKNLYDNSDERYEKIIYIINEFDLNTFTHNIIKKIKAETKILKIEEIEKIKEENNG